jgi:hypothetical protein
MSMARGPEEVKIVKKEKFYSNRHFKKVLVETFEKIKQDPLSYVLVIWVIFTGIALLANRDVTWKWYSVFWLTSALYIALEFTKERKNDIINK